MPTAIEVPHVGIRPLPVAHTRCRNSGLENVVSATSESDLMQCIVCMEMKPRRTSGGEHVIPYALGGSLTIDRVCEDCDSRLGHEADAGLSNHFKIEQRRAELGLRGQSGSVPEPEHRSFKRPVASKRDPKHRVLLRRDRAGRITSRTLPHVEFRITVTPEGMLIEPVAVYIDPNDAHEAKGLAVAALRKAGLEDESTIEMISDSFTATLTPVEAPEEFESTIEVRVGGYKQGILKIAYELAWYWLGDRWLDDPTAIAMRDLLNGRTSSGVRGKVFDDANVAIVARQGDQRVLHVAYLYEFDGKLILFIRLFDLLTAGFEVTEDASRYHVPPNNAIVMNNLQRRYEETNFGPAEPGSLVWQNDSQTT